MQKKLTDEEIVARFEGEPAPFLGLLHAFMDRDGLLSFGAVDALGLALGKSPGALGVTLGFYKKFPIEGIDPPIEPQPLGPIEPPASSPGDSEECVFEMIREPDHRTLDGYRRSGGYEALEKCLAQGTRESLVETVTRSGLGGRGGAGYSTGKKWLLAAEAAGDSKVVVCNGDEGDPGSFKDRTLLELDPHAVIEGMSLAAFATGASLGFIYLRSDYRDAEKVLRTALNEARRASMLGEDIRGSGHSFAIYIRRGAGTYVCGEETVLLNTLEASFPMPRPRPPHPATRGFENRPTVVNNVETLAVVPKIVARGADWYKSLGRGEHVGTRLVSLSGDVSRPGCYEIPAGLALGELLDDWAGGPASNQPIAAVSLAGVSGGFLRSDDFDVELDDESLRRRGTWFGNGAIEVFDEARDMALVAADRMRFFKEQTCFKCEACVLGVEELATLFDEGPRNESFDSWCGKIEEASDSIRRDGICGFAGAAAHTAMSALTRFRDVLRSRFPVSS